MYYNEEKEKVLKKLKTNIKGLTQEEVEKRLKQNGKNVLPKKKRDSILKLFIKEFTSPIELVLVITVIVSFLIGETVDAFVILFIILLDVIMGTYQENKALKSAEALSNMIKVNTKVIRNGIEMIIDSEYLVVGDIILLESGSKVSADARIIESINLEVDESVLTGESTSEIKEDNILSDDTILADRTNMLYAGTNIIKGRCKAVVVSTGINTEIGKIAKEVANVKEEKTPLTIRMNKFTRQISILIIVIAIISASILYTNDYEMKSIFLSVIALAVSAMPEGLPLALTMALTIGSNRMSKKNVIVKNLNAVEALGSCTVIASDKTGTLTVNEQTARKIVLKTGEEFEITGTGYNTDGEVIYSDSTKKEEVQNIINLCKLNNEAYFEKIKDNSYDYRGDSIDIAFFVLAAKEKSEFNVETKLVVPYESDKQYSAVFYEKEGSLRCTIKGSLEKVMSFSEKNNEFIKQNEKLSKEGYRVIAVCDGIVKDTNEKNIKNLDFLGMVAFIDPIREEAKESIKECKRAGIKVIMVTGDHPLTAYSISKELGITENYDDVITGKEVEESYNKGEEYFDNIIKNKKVFSRVTPTDKLHIIESLKRMGEFVSVTGDGVNDAPAIKCANIGVAMGSGTDVAKETADMIIIDDNFKSIVAGIKEGRIAYANIRKIVIFLLSCGLAEVLFYLLSVMFGYEIPMLAIQLLWINVVTDGLQDIALSFETSSTDVMKDKPRSTKESLFNKDLMTKVLIYGITISLMIFIVWKYLMDKGTNLLEARSIIMLLMVFIQNTHVLNCRSEEKSIFKTSLKSNPLIKYTVIGSILLQIVVMNIPFLANFLNITPLPFAKVLLIFIFSLFIVIVSEVYKYIRKIKVKNIS